VHLSDELLRGLVVLDENQPVVVALARELATAP
jgi:hypothetical protein